MYHLHQPETVFAVGKAITLTEGTDVTFIATGEPVSRAMMAAHSLEEEGISCRVISMRTIKWIPIAALIGDSHAALAGHAGFQPGAVKATYGTGSSLMTPTERLITSQKGLATTIAWALIFNKSGK